MRMLEIEQLFQSENTLNEVLEQCKEDFEKIDYYAGLMKTNVTDISEEAKKALNELTGTYMSLKTVLSVAESEKKNREIRHYDSIRIEAGKEGKKFSSAPTERQASAYVIKYRRVRNIIEGYTNACEKAISTLQSMLKFLAEEIKLEKS